MYGYKTFHDGILTGLLNAVRRGTNPHAFLFSGDKGLGKTEAARLLANALVCEKRTGAPCGMCPACVQAAAGTNPDIIMVERPKDKKTIGVDVIRKINDDAAVKPFGMASKVYIIPEGELMTDEAQNAFLKTLEEPPSYAVFIIVTASAEVILPTVLSRCTKVSFPPVPASRLREFIAENYPEALEQADFLCALGEGNPARITRYMTDESYRQTRSECAAMLKAILSEHEISAYTAADFAEAHKEEMEDITDIWLMLLRDIMMLNAGFESNIINKDMKPELNRLAAMYGNERIMCAVKHLIRAKEMMKRYVNLRAMMLGTVLKIKSGR